MRTVSKTVLMLFMLYFSSFAQEWDVPIFISDGNNNFELRLGINPNGTDGFDEGLDEKAPPPPPSGNFDTRWKPVGSGTDDLFIDIRDNSITEKTFVMTYQPESGLGPIVLSWDPDQLAELGTFFIRDAITGELFGPLDMTTQSSFDVSSTGGLTASSLLIVMTPFEQSAPPVADFIGDPTSGFSPLNVNFTDNSTPGGGTITAWSWDFGDGNTSSEQNPAHTYASAGSYTVSLTVTDDLGNGDTETKTDFITVTAQEAPTADFTADPTSGLEPLDVQFSDASSNGSGTITSWSWDFGDGNTSSEQNPAHTYASAGSYTVSLTVTDDLGNGDTETKTDFITVESISGSVISSAVPSNETPFPNDQISVDITIDMSNVEGDLGSFTSNLSWDPAVLDYNENSGLQQGFAGSINLADTSSGNITYNGANTSGVGGSFTVITFTFDVIGAPGADSPLNLEYSAMARAVDFVNLLPLLTVNDGSVNVISPTPPTAAFSGEPLYGLAPLAVQFTDASVAGSATISGWSWDFGDGTTSTEQNPQHTYANPGVYTVTLTVMDDLGESDVEEKADYITVTSPTAPTAAFSGEPLSGLAPLAVQFTDASVAGSATISGWSWDFGDGTTSTEQNPQHIYADSGIFTVSLTVTDSLGLTGTETKSDYIVVNQELSNQAPQLADIDDRNMNEGETLTVSLLATDSDGDSLIFAANLPEFGRLSDNGDGSGTITFSPGYNAAGSYDVTVIVTDNGVPALSDTSVFVLTVNDVQLPTARLQIIHNSADPMADTVDVYVNGERFLNDFGYSSATPFQDVPANIILDIGFADKNSKSVDDTLINIPVMFKKNKKYIAIANGVLGSGFEPNPDGEDISFGLYIIKNALEESRGRRLSSLFAFQGVTDAPIMKIDLRNHRLLKARAGYGMYSPYMPVAPISYVIDFIESGGSNEIIASFEADISDWTAEAGAIILSGFVDPEKNKDGSDFRLYGVKADGEIVHFTPLYFNPKFFINLTSVESAAGMVTDFVLEQNYPNPFNPVTEIKYQVPTSEQVTIEIFDIFGKKVKTLVQKRHYPGKYSIKWNATNEKGNRVPTGTYFLMMRAGSYSVFKKMILLK